MTTEEAVAAFVSGTLALWLWGRWYERVVQITPLACRPGDRWPLYLTPAACLFLLLLA